MENPNVQSFNYAMPGAVQPKKKKKHGCLITFLIFLVLLIAAGAVAAPYVIKEVKYRSASMCMDTKDFDTAIFIFSSLDTYRDSQEKITETKYLKAQNLAEEGEYEYAIEILQEIEPYEDSRDLTEEYIGEYIAQLLENDKYDEAKDYLESVNGIDGSDDLEKACDYYDAVADYNAKKYYSALEKFEALGKYEDSEKYYAMSEHQYIVMMGYGNSTIEAQKTIFSDLEKYKDDEEVAEMLRHPIYNPMKIAGEWETEDGDVLAFTNEKITIGLPAKISGKSYLSFNGDYVCAVDSTTKVETKLFKIVSFEEPDSATPKKMVVFNEYDQKEYTFERTA